MGCISSQLEGEEVPDDKKVKPKQNAQFIIDNPGKIYENYDIDKKDKISSGSTGYVCKAKQKKSGHVRAVKTIPKAHVRDMESLKREFKITQMMDHPNISKHYESFEDHRNIYVVTELCQGGQLFDRIIDQGYLSEIAVAHLMEQIIRAVDYIHKQGVFHRDIRPENFLFLNKEHVEKNPLKLVHFAVACKVQPGQIMQSKVGTPYYVSPQVIMGKYDQAADLWSCGIIMYVLLCGYPPFNGDNDAEIVAKVRLGNFSFDPADWRHISEDAKEIVRGLLQINPRDRFTAHQALKYEWMRLKAPGALGHTSTNFVDSLRVFRSQNKLIKVAVQLLAEQLNEVQLMSLHHIFTMIDSNSDGFLTNNELKEALLRSNLQSIPPDVLQMMQEIDSDGSGMIDSTEFLANALERRSRLQEDVCWNAFRVFDKNGDGSITTEELSKILCNDDVEEIMGAKVIADLMNAVDQNGDGIVDFQEFMMGLAKGWSNQADDLTIPDRSSIMHVKGNADENSMPPELQGTSVG